MRSLPSSFASEWGVTPNRVIVAWAPAAFLYERGYFKVNNDGSETFGDLTFKPYSSDWFALGTPLQLFELAYLLGRDNPLYGEYGVRSSELESFVELTGQKLGLSSRDLPWLPDTCCVWAYFQQLSSSWVVDRAWANSLASGQSNTIGALGTAIYNAMQDILPTEGGALMTYSGHGVWPQGFRLGPNEIGVFFALAGDGSALVFPRPRPGLTFDQLQPILAAAAAGAVARDPAEFQRVAQLQATTSSAPAPSFVGAAVDEINARVAGEKPWLDPGRAWDTVFGSGSAETASSWAKWLLLAFAGFVAVRSLRAVSP